MKRSYTLPFFIFIILGISPTALHADGEAAVQFREHQFIKTYYGDGTTSIEPDYGGEPYLHVNLSYLEPVSFGGDPVPEELRQFCSDFFFGTEGGAEGEDEIRSLFENVAEATIADWEENGLSVLEDFPDAEAAAMWEYESRMSVDYNKNGIVCLGNHFYQFAGGAHGIYNSDYAVYDIENRREVTLDMIFTGDWYGAVTYIITEEAKRLFEVDQFSSLTAAGFFVDELEPTGNFYLSDEGITFVYSVYEVAPYVMGGIDVTISYEDLGVLLDTDGPAGRITGN